MHTSKASDRQQRHLRMCLFRNMHFIGVPFIITQSEGTPLIFHMCALCVVCLEVFLEVSLFFICVPFLGCAPFRVCLF